MVESGESWKRELSIPHLNPEKRMSNLRLDQTARKDWAAGQPYGVMRENRQDMKTTNKKLNLTDVCCERFFEFYQSGEISHSYEKHSALDETEWRISGFGHLYYCPFCGAFIKGRGFGNYDETSTQKKQERQH